MGAIKGLRVVLYFCGFLTCALLVLIIGYIFYRGVPNISWELLTSQSSYIKDTIGILPNILNTLYLVLLAMVIVYMAMSLLMAVLWSLLQSPDLAITEAAVGAGVTSILFFLTLKRIHALKGTKDG